MAALWVAKLLLNTLPNACLALQNIFWLLACFAQRFSKLWNKFAKKNEHLIVINTIATKKMSQREKSNPNGQNTNGITIFQFNFYHMLSFSCAVLQK